MPDCGTQHIGFPGEMEDVPRGVTGARAPATPGVQLPGARSARRDASGRGGGERRPRANASEPSARVPC